MKEGISGSTHGDRNDNNPAMKAPTYVTSELCIDSYHYFINPSRKVATSGESHASGPIIFLTIMPFLSMIKVSGTPVIPNILAALLLGSKNAGRINPLFLKKDSVY